jgi:ABC-type Zn uptake system ZnuABC Zn-binding protein ZnuA
VASILVAVETEHVVVPRSEHSTTTPFSRARGLRHLAVAVLLVAATATRADAPPIPVVATIEPLGMLLRELGGARLVVTVLVPSGASPHTFEPQPSDLAKLAGASLLVEVGGSFDAWVARLRSAASSRTPVFTILALPGLELLDTEQAQHGLRSSGGATASDPHVWLDPIRVRDILAPALSERLAALDASARPTYAPRLETFQNQLTELDREIRTQLAGPRRSYVAFHPAWRYFAARYELDEIGVVERWAGEGPTPRELASLVTAAERARIPAILIEPQLEGRVARTLAREFGATVVLVDPNGDPADPERARYPDLMRWNARAFANALGGTEQ